MVVGPEQRVPLPDTQIHMAKEYLQRYSFSIKMPTLRFHLIPVEWQRAIIQPIASSRGLVGGRETSSTVGGPANSCGHYGNQCG